MFLIWSSKMSSLDLACSLERSLRRAAELLFLFLVHSAVSVCPVPKRGVW